VPACQSQRQAWGFSVRPASLPLTGNRTQRTKALSIQNKITLLASACLVVVVGLLAGLSLEQRRADEDAIAATSTRLLLEAAQATLHA